ncbi:amidohydrolase family protein [Rhizoctonia solani]|uniref:Amidohydrolase family protein n=1 Tax=Rhizoctonia solani TaxID=456999 RepID=A0A8H8NYK9_9AGAM|nr:amidohydrolase family protein [Rhizoctonia solani]QRW21800.1 amidohydrolase family protein [Rhizoctonia solani]
MTKRLEQASSRLGSALDEYLDACISVHLPLDRGNKAQNFRRSVESEWYRTVTHREKIERAQEAVGTAMKYTVNRGVTAIKDLPPEIITHIPASCRRYHSPISLRRVDYSDISQRTGTVNCDTALADDPNNKLQDPSNFVRWIAPGQKPFKLTFGSTLEEFPRFCARSSITQLHIETWVDNILCEIIRQCPALKILILSAFDFGDPELHLILPPVDAASGDSQRSTSTTHIDHLYLLDFEELKFDDILATIQQYSVQSLTIWKGGLTYRTDEGMKTSKHAREIRAKLSVIPSNQCIVEYFPGSTPCPLFGDFNWTATFSRKIIRPNHSGFEERLVSDRFDPESNGARPVLLQNATIWTGLKGADGRVQVTKGDLLLANGLIQAIFEGEMSTIDLIKRGFKNEGIELKNVQGAWITPAIFDLHSHVGDSSIPSFKGTGDDNSLKAPVQPFLRSIDGVNTHDEAFKLFRAGGVATSGLFAPHNRSEEDNAPRWRHIKHACGENPSGVYFQTRMDSIWNFRQVYNHWEVGDIRGEDFPEDLEYESLVDALRGRAKVHVHCYEAVDLDGIVRLSNEFKLPIAAFHHAHEAYLVPDLIKQAYGKPPALAIFSSFARYKREAYRGSPYAPKILNENGLRVAMKSDGPPAINARYLFYEAAQAHYYGLPEDEAIASLTSTPAQIAGYSHRLGYIKQGYDADIVIWDSHPLSLGATPQQVYIDGSPQLDEPLFCPNPTGLKHLHTLHQGLPELLGSQNPDTIIFKNVGSFMRDKPQVLRRGDIIIASRGRVAKVVDLQGGSIIPGLISSGASIGLVEIDQEPSTNDGNVPDPLERDVPTIVGSDKFLVRGVDGLSLSHRGGVTTIIEAPFSPGLIQGVSVAFRSGAKHKLQPGAISRREVALHVLFGSTKIATLRRLLLDAEEGSVYARVVKGELPLGDRGYIWIRNTLGVLWATEAHIIADKIAEANVGIILAPLRSIPYIWDQVDISPGLPFHGTPLQILQEAGVTVGLGSPSIIVTQAWDVPQTRFSRMGHRRFQRYPKHLWSFGSLYHKFEKVVTLLLDYIASWYLLCIPRLYRLPDLDTDLVAYRGGDALSYSSKTVAVMSTEREQNDLFE